MSIGRVGIFRLQGSQRQHDLLTWKKLPAQQQEQLTKHSNHTDGMLREDMMTFDLPERLSFGAAAGTAQHSGNMSRTARNLCPQR